MGRTKFCCKIMLWPWPSRKRPNCCARHVVLIWWSFLWNSFEIRLQITKLWAGHEWDVRTYVRTDGRTRRRLYAPSKFFGEHNKSVLKHAQTTIPSAITINTYVQPRIKSSKVRFIVSLCLKIVSLTNQQL